MRYRKSAKGGVEVFAPQRGWLLLTPEEWVRRHVVAHLTERMAVPPTNIVEEYPVTLNGQNQRADVVVIGPDTKPWLLIECKAPEVTLDQSVVAQAVRYNSVVGAPNVAVTNGLTIQAFTTTDGIHYSDASFPL